MRKLSALFQCAVILFILFQTHALHAASIGLDEMLGRALEKTELILASEEQVTGKKHFKDQAASYMNPNFEANSGRKTSGGTVYGISVTQPFYYPGKQDLRAAVAGQDVELAKLGLREARLFVYYETMRLAAACAIAGQRAEHAKERVARFAVMQKYMNSRPFASPQKRIEKYIVENRMDIFAKELFRIQSEREILWAGLNTFLDMPEKPDIKVELPSAMPALEIESLIRLAGEHNTAVASILAGVRKKSLERDLARKEAWPDFGLSAFYSGETGGERERIIGGGVAFTLPVFNRNGGAVQGLDAELRSENLRLAFERRALRERVRAAYHEFTIAAGAVARLSDAHLERMHRQQREADDAFERGLLDFVTYLEIESDIYEKHQVIFASRYEYVEKLSQLLWLSGEMKNPLRPGGAK
jgi:outer membrane protein TolC